MNKMLSCLLLVLLITGCSAGPDSGLRDSGFNGEAAFEYLQAQCDLGPRVPNSDAHQQAMQMLTEHFNNCGAEVELQRFKVKDPYSTDTLRLVNIIARFNPQKDNRLLFCAHWESRPRCERDPDPAKRDLPLPAANDGASGVAVMMQLAVHIQEMEIDRGIDIILFDGEDWGKPGDLDYYLLGSKHFARSVDAEQYDYAVLLDLVGDKDQKFYREPFSNRYNPDLVENVWKRAHKLGMQDYFNDSLTNEIFDDHISLLTARIKAIDIIDFDFPYFHTTEDTPDKCSAESLERVGRLVLSLILDPL